MPAKKKYFMTLPPTPVTPEMSALIRALAELRDLGMTDITRASLDSYLDGLSGTERARVQKRAAEIMAQTGS